MEACACGAMTISVNGILIVAIASITITLYILLLSFETAIATITSTNILCHMIPNNTTFVCPKPWFFKSYDVAMIESRILATHLWNGIIAVAVCSIIFYVIFACATGVFTKSKNYQSI